MICITAKKDRKYLLWVMHPSWSLLSTIALCDHILLWATGTVSVLLQWCVGDHHHHHYHYHHHHHHQVWLVLWGTLPILRVRKTCCRNHLSLDVSSSCWANAGRLSGWKPEKLPGTTHEAPQCAQQVGLFRRLQQSTGLLPCVLQVLSGNIEHVPIKEKAKFAQEFFPDVWHYSMCLFCRWLFCVFNDQVCSIYSKNILLVTEVV